jgi:uncharacterized membrane protein YfcA
MHFSTMHILILLLTGAGVGFVSGMLGVEGLFYNGSCSVLGPYFYGG